MAVDIAGIEYFAPIVAFLLVFVVVFALLVKTKLLEGVSKYALLFISFLIATIFVSAAGIRTYVLTITPWFALLVITLFFILLIVGFVGKPLENMTKGIGVVAVIILVIIFLVSAFVVFNAYLFGANGEVKVLNWFLEKGIYNTRVFGALLLLAISALVSWVLIKVK